MATQPINISIAINESTDTSVQGSATLFWNPPLELNGSTIITYMIRGYIDGIEQIPLIDTLSASVTRYVIRYLYYNTNYSFSVIARTDQGDSPPSQISSVIQIPLPVPSAPQNVTIYNAAHSLTATIQWIDPVMHGSDGSDTVINHSIIVYDLTDGTQKTITV